MTVSDWALRHPIFPLVAVTLLALLGLRAAVNMPLTYLPDLGDNRIVLRLVADDATLDAMDQDLAQPVEQALAALPQITAITSEITATDLRLTLNLRNAHHAQDTLAAVSDRINALIPDAAIGFRIAEIRAQSSRRQPVLELAVVPRDGDLIAASQTIETVIRPALREVEGLTDITLRGMRQQRLTIQPDPAQLAAADLTLEDLSRQISSALGRTTTTSLPPGADAGPMLVGLADYAQGRDPAAALALLPLTTGLGQTVPLATVARVVSGPAAQGSAEDGTDDWIVRHDGAAAIFAQIHVDPAVDLGGVLAALDDRIAALGDSLSRDERDLRIAVVNRPADRATASLAATQRALLEGAILVIAVIALTLKARRATVLAALALPLSILPTLLVMQMLGLSLNIVSLLALTLASGVLVDDAIVEIENIHKHMHRGLRARDAVARAMRDIAVPVVATSVAILAIFAPLAGMPGEAGRYFWAFGATLCIATLMSLAVSRLVIPPLAARFPDALRPLHDAPQQPGRIARQYGAILRRALAYRWLCLVGAAGIAVFSVVSAMTHPGSFIPLDPPDHMQVDLTLPHDMSPGARARATDALARDLAALQGVRGVTTLTPTELGGAARLLIETDGTPSTQRTLRDRLDAQADARAIVLNSAGQAPLVIDLAAPDRATLALGAATLVAGLADLPQVGPARFVTPTPYPELRLVPDAQTLRHLGLTQDDLARALQSLTPPQDRAIGQMDGPNGTGLSVYLASTQAAGRPTGQMTAHVMGSPERDLAFAALRLPDGQTFPLAALGRFDLHLSDLEIIRRDGLYVQRVISDPVDHQAARNLTRVAAQSVATLAHDMPGLTILPNGDTRLRHDMMQDLKTAASSMILILIATLFVLFRSMGQVIVILASLLFSLCGGMLVLIATGLPLSLPVMIGVLLLFGIVAKNGILLIDRAQRLNRAGAPMAQALCDAALDRARPILMTSAAMIAGMAPAALPGLEGAAFRQPLALTVIGGVAMSTILSLVLTPALALIAHDLGRRLSALATLRLWRPRAAPPVASES